MPELSLSNIIQVSILGTPTAFVERNVNSIGFFTTDPTNNSDVFRSYRESTEVGKDFGTESETAKMAENIFAQNPNIFTGNGSLNIIPFVVGTVTATPGSTQTKELSANFTNIFGSSGVLDGKLKVLINAQTKDLTGLDFTKSTNMTDVANVIGRDLPDVKVEALKELDDITFADGAGGGTKLTEGRFLATDLSTLSNQVRSTVDLTMPEIKMISATVGGTDLSAANLLDKDSTTEEGSGFITKNINSNLMNFDSVTDGKLNITFNDFSFEITSLTFDSNATVQEIADVIKAKFIADKIPLIATDFDGNSIFIGATRTNVGILINGQDVGGPNVPVTDGQIDITLNNVTTELTGLDFTSDTTNISTVITVIQDALTIVGSNILVQSSPTNINVLEFFNKFKTDLPDSLKFTSKKVGLLANCSLAATGTPTDLFLPNFFDGATQIITPGANETGESLVDAIARTEGDVFYAGVLTNLRMIDTTIISTASSIQAQDRMFLYTEASTDAVLGIGTTISQANQNKTRILLYTLGISEANLFTAAYLGRAFSNDFVTSNTSATMEAKTLVNISPDLGITQTLRDQAVIAGVDLYPSYDGIAQVLSTGGNKFFDIPYSIQQLKFALQAAGFNFLRQTNFKIPQTESGLSSLKSVYAGVIRRFVINGVFAPGSWTSPDTFGDKEIFLQNILDSGFYIFSLPITEQPSGDREQRKAPVIQAANKFAGAIHTSLIIDFINE